VTAYIGIDLGGTKAAAIRLDESQHVVARHRSVARSGKPDLVGRAVDSARALWVPGVAAVGVGIAGLVRWPEGVFAWGPHVAGREVPVRAELERELGVPVVVDNDANTALFAESRTGAARGIDHALMVTLGTGIGGAVLAGGEVYRGGSFAGEFGHMTVIDDGPVCDCGRRGCWETLASGPALARMALEVIARRPRSAFAGRFRGTDPLAEAITAAAAEGDEVAASLLADAGEHFGRGLANLIAAFDPEMVVIGGGLGSVGEALIGPARDIVARRLHGAPHRTAPAIVVAELGEAAGAVGAALLAAARHAERSGPVPGTVGR
jgi:glucokinase